MSDYSRYFYKGRKLYITETVKADGADIEDIYRFCKTHSDVELVPAGDGGSNPYIKGYPAHWKGYREATQKEAKAYAAHVKEEKAACLHAQARHLRAELRAELKELRSRAAKLGYKLVKRERR